MYKFEVVNMKTGEVTYSSDSKETALDHLATALAYKYVHKSPYIKRVVRKNNYTGTETYTVYQDNGYKWVITVKEL